MKALKRIYMAIGVFLLLGLAYAALPAETQSLPVSAQQASDKYDGDCTGHETAGRCADKCPASTSEGVYHLQGYDKDTGAAVCRIEYYHACPYADAQSADSPECQKLTAEHDQATTMPEQQSVDDFGGK